jgi:hypothetical protein
MEDSNLQDSELSPEQRVSKWDEEWTNAAVKGHTKLMDEHERLTRVTREFHQAQTAVSKPTGGPAGGFAEGWPQLLGVTLCPNGPASSAVSKGIETTAEDDQGDGCRT